MSKKFGWINIPSEVERFVATLDRPIFGLSAHELRDSGKGKVVLLHNAVTKKLGTFPVRNQTIGDCVSQGAALAIDILKVLAPNSDFSFLTASEALYALSRVEGLGRGQLGNEDGSLGGWMADAVKRLGTLRMTKYDSVDLRKYSGARAKEWGRVGLPDELEPFAREHPVRTVSTVRSYDEARDAIANGYPVPVCSMVGFEGQQKRDSEGFLKPRGQWAHCMCFIALDDEHKRPGLLCMNSWGTDWVGGPSRHDQPDGSFWVDATTCDRMLKEGDSFAYSNFEGYPFRDIGEHYLG